MAKKKIKNGLLDLLGLGTTTTHYKVEGHYGTYKRKSGSGNSSRTSSKKTNSEVFHGHKIVKEDGEWFIPSLNEGPFDKKDDARLYILATKNQRNPMKVRKNKGRRNPGLTSFIPIKGIRKNADGSISLLVDSAKKAIKPITGMLKGVGKVIGNPPLHNTRQVTKYYFRSGGTEHGPFSTKTQANNVRWELNETKNKIFSRKVWEG